MKQITLCFFLTMVLLIMAAFIIIGLAGCSTAQLDTTADILDITDDALSIDVSLHEPNPKDRDAHWRWCEQQPHHPHCH